jgi:hypothetical protein
VSGPRETVEKETVETTNLYRLRRDGDWRVLFINMRPILFLNCK